jgi:hypothetical protein
MVNKMKQHLKKAILEFEEINGSLYTGCKSGMVILDRNLEYLQPLLRMTNKLAFKFSKLYINKLKMFKDMEQYSPDHDTIKIDKTYFSAFRLYALLNKIGYVEGIVEIYNAGDLEYPVLIKANNKEMFLAPVILLEDLVNNIPSIEQFGVK